MKPARITEHRIWATANQILTRKQLEAFTLRHQHQLSLADIAHHLGISRQAATERLRKAEQRIAQHLPTRKAA